MERSDKFTGEVGKYCTTYNSLVRILGRKEADSLKENGGVYKKINFALHNAANKHQIVYGESIRHPKYKVPAFYGMKKEMAKELENKNSRLVSAYKSDWLFEWLKDFFNINNKL